MGFSNVYGVPHWGETKRGETLVLDGVACAAGVREEVAQGVEELVAAGAARPGLATVLVGEDPASEVYVGAKHRACAEVGIESIDHRLPADAPEAELLALVESLNRDPAVSGILVQLPLPAGFDSAALVDRIEPAKDVDGLSTLSVGALWRGRAGLSPCTPAGVMELLRRHRFPLEGKRAVIVGRSELVGKPLAALLLAADATVTVCHSRTLELERVCAEADLLVAALGRPAAIGERHVKPGAAVVDVGISRTENGIVGDVDAEAVRPVAAALSPVPGGVGPMTIACLLRNTLSAAKATGR